MKYLTKTRSLMLMLCSAMAAGGALESRADKEARNKLPVVQLAILLDTSGSMEGLIEQAKGQLWKIVNEFIGARQNGRQPEVQVALFEYGKSGLAASDGYVRMIQPLTSDLDKISEELFALKTNGGEEYCGWVIRDAVTRLEWSDSPDVYRGIFIAGNEPFTQGPVHYADACKAAISKGIVVNTIHCGEAATGINTKWQEGALIADGKYMSIDQSQAVVHFEAPQDAEIVRLSSELNKTYLGYGHLAPERAERQELQDANALSLRTQGAALNRAITKASANYRNSDWDLVDAVKEKKVKVQDLKREELPKELQALSADERETVIEEKAAERARLQEKIKHLNQERSRFLENTHALPRTNTLDAVIIKSVREQAEKRNYRFE